MGKITNIRKVFVRGEGFDPIDADIDFSDNPNSGKGRDYIIQHLANKYNKDGNIHFALVGVRSVYSIKSALRDIARVYDVPANETFAVTKEIDDDYTIEQNKKRSKIIASYFSKYPEVEAVAQQVVGVTSNFGVHAGGVVISDKHYPMQDYVPLQRSHSGIPATLYDKDELQDTCGFVKYDLLGVTALSQVAAVKYTLNDNEIYKDYPITPEPFTLCKKQHHKNIFQFESPLGKRAFGELRMESIYDLSNASGMIRQMGTTGGRAMYDKYKRLSNAPEQQVITEIKSEVSQQTFDIIYPILKPTYGVLIYQEQLSFMVQHLSKGKFSFGDGNSVRKKLGKLVTKYGLIDEIQGKPELLKKWHAEVVTDVLDKYLVPFLHEDDIDEDGRKFLNFELDKKGNLPLPKLGVLNWFIIGSTYLFSVIHSVSYSYISYNQLYQKYYHPVEFWLGALNSNGKEDVANYISSATSESKIVFLPPSVNASDIKFTKENERSIRYGLSYIVGLDKASIEIIDERNANGNYLNFADFLKRMKGKRVVNKKVIENLIFGNAFENEEPKDCYEAYLAQKNESSILTWNKKDYTNRENEALNCNISFPSISKTQLSGTIPLDEIPDGGTMSCAINVISITNKKTKTGKPYRLLSIVDCNNGAKSSVFVWDNSVNIEANQSYKTRILKKGDFISWSN
jgi:DNA polymerase-3 subunit alpha